MLKQTQTQNDGQMGFWSFRQYCIVHQSTTAMRDVDPLLYRDNLRVSLLMEVVADTSLH